MSECAKCGAPMQEGQDWCLQCGAGADGSLGGGPGWRTGAAILAATTLLVAGASVAAYAALTKTKPKPKTVALLRPVTTSPIPPIPGTGGAGTSTAPGIPTTVAPAPPPKIPTQTPTPTTPPPPAETTPSTETNTASTPTSSGSTGQSGKGAGEGGGSQSQSESEAEPPSPILLDTNAASTYNPSAYPATLFSDPSLAIDGEDQTAWTAQVLPEKAPAMAEGLALDLKSPQKLGSATVKTSTTGAEFEVYGADGTALPATLPDPAWVRLVGLKTLKKKTTSLKLKTKGKAYRFVVLWLVKAPPGSTAAKPGAVAIDELELFPPS